MGSRRLVGCALAACLAVSMAVATTSSASFPADVDVIPGGPCHLGLCPVDRYCYSCPPGTKKYPPYVIDCLAGPSWDDIVCLERIRYKTYVSVRVRVKVRRHVHGRVVTKKVWKTIRRPVWRTRWG